MSEKYKIHKTALVDKEATIGNDVEIGPYCIIGPNVEIGNGCKFQSHVVLDGHLKIGNGNKFFQFCSIGAPPQDLTYKDQPTRVEIGENNVFREYVSIHRGTLKQDSVTKIGNSSLFMAYAHLGHDVVVGDNCIIVNAVQVAGHVKIGNRCTISGGTAISQFVNIGNGAYIAGASAVDRDVPCYCVAMGNRAHLKGVNIIGLRRNQIPKQLISETVDFYRTMESSPLSPRAFVEHQELMEEFKGNHVIEKIADFILKSEIGIASFNN